MTQQVSILNHMASTLRYGIARMLGQSHEGRRDLYSLYGYDENLTFEKMYLYARRHGIANRLTFGVAKSCWGNGFDIIEGTDPNAKDEDPALADELLTLRECGIVNKLQRADTLNRIGKFSVLFVGVPDGKQPAQELGRASPEKLDQVYFKAFAYDGITVSQFDNDRQSKRYGLPQMYRVAVMDRGQLEKDQNRDSLNIHWSRIVHLNENALDSDVEGMGALEPVFNRILDLDKACGGSAEAYFRNAGPKLKFEIDPEFASNMDAEDKEQFNEAASKFTNDMQNMIRAAGTTVDAIETPHASPLDTVKVLLWEIAGQSGLPVRSLTGEGSGQLAGSEDRIAVNAIISDRQRVFCSLVAKGALQILEGAGMIDLPEQYSIRWPIEEAHNEIEQSEIADKKAGAIEKLSRAKTQPGGDDIDLAETASALGVEIATEDGIGDE
jgi:hypothetical protein